MIVKKKTRGFICTTAHPEGCAYNVNQQIDYVKAKGSIKSGKRVLVIGASTGYGLASRIVQAFSGGASTIGVFYEKEASGRRTASAGWYNAVAFEKAAEAQGLYSKSINGDAFSNELKARVIDTIKKDLGKIDMVIYSLASPRRQMPDSDEVNFSVLKPIGQAYTNKTVDFHSGHISDITIEPAVKEEIDATVKVMGGEDWALWINALKEANVLDEGIETLAYSYIGPDLTHAVYRQGTIGKAKDHLEQTAQEITKDLEHLSGKAFVSVNKALVTQSSAAIPVVPLYISVLYKVMKEMGNHENCIQQCYRLFDDSDLSIDENDRVRLDDWEMKADVQSQVHKLWHQVDSHNINDLTDIEGYRQEFYHLFGFDLEGIDYDRDIEVSIKHDNIAHV